MNHKLRLVASACFGVLMAIAMVFGIASAYAGVAKPVITSQIIAYMGPTNDPTGRGFYEKALPILGEYNNGRELEFIEYPAQLRPMTGKDSLSLDQSVAIGVQNALTAIAERDQSSIFVLTGSQSAVVVTELKKYYLQHPDQAPPAEDLSFLLISNPDRPNGGLLARFPGLYIPQMDMTFNGATPNDQYVTYDVAWAYEGISNFPRYPINLLADINAYMGMKTLHGKPPELFDPATDVSVSVVNGTTYYTLMPEHLPLFGPMLDAGWGPLVNVIEPLTKVWVDTAYDNNDPRSNPGIAESARLIMPLRNIVVALIRTPGAIIAGLSTIPSGIRTLLTGNPVVNVKNIITATADDMTESVRQDLKLASKLLGVKLPMALDSSVASQGSKILSSVKAQVSNRTLTAGRFTGSSRPLSAQNNVRPAGQQQAAKSRAARPHATGSSRASRHR